MAEGWENHFHKPSYMLYIKENKLQTVPLWDLVSKQSYSIQEMRLCSKDSKASTEEHSSASSAEPQERCRQLNNKAAAASHTSTVTQQNLPAEG